MENEYTDSAEALREFNDAAPTVEIPAETMSALVYGEDA